LALLESEDLPYHLPLMVFIHIRLRKWIFLAQVSGKVVEGDGWGFEYDHRHEFGGFATKSLSKHRDLAEIRIKEIVRVLILLRAA